VACFIVPLTLGVIVAVLKRALLRIGEKLKLDILETLLLGGALILAAEHAWHGELVPWPPFLTAMSNPEEWSIAVHEIGTAGVVMTLAVASVWGAIVLATRTPLKLGVKIRSIKHLMHTRS